LGNKVLALFISFSWSRRFLASLEVSLFPNRMSLGILRIVKLSRLEIRCVGVSQEAIRSLFAMSEAGRCVCVARVDEVVDMQE
jgi:hypothetical protein